MTLSFLSVGRQIALAGEGGDASALDSTPDHVSDPDAHERQLLERAGAGDRQALADLYAAHRPLAEHVARRTCRPSDVDDVVSEAFAKIMEQIGRGGGPRVSFRAYLITAVRSASADLARRHARTFPTDDVELPRRAASPSSSVDQPHSTLRLESELLASAVATLPVRWQLAVWWVSVEGRPLSEVGERLGINANAAAALAFRAREGLRDAYLALHAEHSNDPSCSPWRAGLPAFVRGRLPAARTAGTMAHLRDCHPCRSVVDRLHELLATGVPA